MMFQYDLPSGKSVQIRLMLLALLELVFPSGGSFHSQCKGMARGFSFPLHMLQPQLASFPLKRKLIILKMFGLTIILSPSDNNIDALCIR